MALATANKWISALVLPVLLGSLLISCITGKEITDPDLAYDLKKFDLAAELYEEDYNSAGSDFLKGQIAFRIGECYLKTNEPGNASKWFEKAVDANYPDARFQYALMLKSLEQYEDAIEQFKQFGKEEPFRKSEADDQIAICRDAIEWVDAKTDCKIYSLDGINSNASDYGLVFYESNSFAFSSTRSNALGELPDDWTGEQFADIYTTTLNGSSGFSDPVSISELINTDFHDASISFNKDQTIAYFTRCGSSGEWNDFCRIYQSVRNQDGSWREPTEVFIFEDSVNVIHPFISPDGTMLIVASDASGGYGGTDLYYCYKTASGWNNPVNFGPKVNSSGNEKFPYMAENGILYFASDGLPGMGGLDIFSSEKSGKNWKNPVNLKYPINSGADDFGIIFDKLQPDRPADPIRSSGYITSSRDGGKGSDDIYRFVYENINYYELIGTVLGKVYADPSDPNSEVIDSIPLSGALVSLRTEMPNDANLIDEEEADEDGKFYFELEEGRKYSVLGSMSPEYLNRSEDVSTIDKKDPNNLMVTLEVEIVLDRIFEEQEIEIPNIYYDYDETTLRAESLPVLDELITLLEENPEIVVEIGSHTDARGSDAYNMKLSQGRAESVIRYMVENGINIERLKAKGYGETRLVNGCEDGVECSEEEHQQNRRTTFKILAEKFILESQPPEEIPTDN